MTFIPILTVTQNASKNWIFTWSNLGQAFSRVVLWGTQLSSITTFTYTWTGLGYQDFPPPLEITYENQLTLSEQYRPYLVIQWYGETSASYYKIEVFNNSSWSQIKTFTESGLWVYTYQTQILKDETSYQYRVTVVDSVGNNSPARHYNIYMVCPPVPPDNIIKVSYLGHDITVSTN